MYGQDRPEESYDYVEWKFLEKMMIELGLPIKLVDWVMACVSSMSYSIQVNGIPHPPFKAKKGLRQGDPMSLYIFALGMEYLSRRLRTLDSERSFGYHLECSTTRIIGLLFADDLLIFCKGNLDSIKQIKVQLEKFSNASGLEANMDKFALYCAGMDPGLQQQLAEALGMPLGELPFKYLGVPLSYKELSLADCTPLVDSISRRVLH